MARAEHLALDLKRVAQAWVQSRGHDHQPGFNLISRGKRDMLPSSFTVNRRDFRWNMTDICRNLLPHRIHQIVVHDARPSARLAVNQPAIAHHPDLAVDAGLRQHLIGKSGETQQLQLGIVQLLAAEFRALRHVGFNEQRVMPGLAKHGGSSGSGQPAADNGHICGQSVHATTWAMDRTARSSVSDFLILPFRARPARQSGAAAWPAAVTGMTES